MAGLIHRKSVLPISVICVRNSGKPGFGAFSEIRTWRSAFPDVLIKYRAEILNG